MQLSNPGQLFWAWQHSCWSNGKTQVESEHFTVSGAKRADSDTYLFSMSVNRCFRTIVPLLYRPFFKRTKRYLTQTKRYGVETCRFSFSLVYWPQARAS